MDTILTPDLFDRPGPKYRVLSEGLREAVAAGQLAPGARLPPVRDLAWTLGITPGTVARAYTLLTDEGLLRAEVGRGTFVAQAGTAAREAPGLIEIDAVRHTEGGDVEVVNLYSPHLPSVGQGDLIRQVLAQIAQVPPSGVMHYPSRHGASAARAAMADWISEAPIGPVGDADLVLSMGGQSGVMLALQCILRGRRPVVLLEELAYPGFRRAAEALRAEVVAVAMDVDGILPDALEAAIARHPEAQVLCTSPEVHSPTTRFTPMPRRREIAEVLARHDLHVIDDDCYRMGEAAGESYRRLLPERGWYVSSVSKIITPALRAGCVVAPSGQGAALQRVAEVNFFGLATPMSDLVALLLPHPQLPAILAAVRARLAEFVDAARRQLDGYALHWRPDVAFMWLDLPEGWRATAFCRAAERRGVQVRAAEEFAAREANAPHAVRLAINAGVSLRSFDAAMGRLRALLDDPPDQIGV